MRYNISQFNNWLKCQQYSVFHDVLRRGLPGGTPATELGSAFHTFMEAKLKSLSEPEFGDLGPEAAVEWVKLLPFARAWTPPEDWQVQFVEKSLNWPLGVHTLQGRLDAIVKWNKGFWSLQWKTCGQSQSLESLGELVRVGFHECAYQWLAEQNGFVPFRGTILVTAKKLSQKAIKENRNPIAPPVYLTRSPKMLTERMHQLEAEVNDMALKADPPGFLSNSIHPWVLKNTNACMGPYRNKPCQYFDVCHEGASIDSLPFENLEDRYEVAPEE